MNNNRTARDLLKDQSFLRYARGTADSEEISKWDGWIQESDANRGQAKKAIAEIVGFAFNGPDNGSRQRVWSKLNRSTHSKKNSTHLSPAGSNVLHPWVYRAAAVLLLIGAVAYAISMHSSNNERSRKLTQITPQKTVSTQQDERKTITFSNNAKIVVNQNSSITYSINPGDKKTINVTLDGEAFFETQNKPDNTAAVFLVNTPDGVIRDIGTKFLVSVNQNNSEVTLQEGEVKIRPNAKGRSSEEITLKKGKQIRFSSTQILQTKSVNPTFFTSWATGFMQFDDTKISAFARFIEYKYKLKVIIKDPELKNKRLSGGVYFRSLKELVRSVSKVTKIKVFQSEDRSTIFIGNPYK